MPADGDRFFLQNLGKGSTALEWIAKSKLAISGVLHLLDDTLLIDKTFSACEQNLSRFLAMCDDLGVPMAPEKTMGPSSVLCFAGIELDTDKMEARLPEEKLRKCVTLIYEFLKRKKVSLKEMQSLIGLLNFTCSVVIPGRTFPRRIINLTVGVNRPTHLIRLTRIVKDLKSHFLGKMENRKTLVKKSNFFIISLKHSFQ